MRAGTLKFKSFAILDIFPEKCGPQGKYSENNFVTRKMATLAKSGHFMGKIVHVKFIRKFDFSIQNYLKISK